MCRACTYAAGCLSVGGPRRCVAGSPVRGGRCWCVEAELDAAFFHLYGIGCDDVDYIMGTFPIVKRKDIAEQLRTMRESRSNLAVVTQEEQVIGLITRDDVLQRPLAAPRLWERHSRPH